MRADKNAARRTAVCASFAVLALGLSYLESLIPLELILPIPGVKPGLANLAVTLVMVYVSPGAAAAVSLTRVLLSALLFGSPASLFLSLCGAATSYAMLYCLWRAARKGFVRVSFAGVGALCAAAHAVGQIAAACLLFGTTAIITYLPVLASVSALIGTLTGLLLNAAVPLCDRAARTFGFSRS